MGEGFQRSVGQQGSHALQTKQNPKTTLQKTTRTPQLGTKLAIGSIHRKIKQVILLFTSTGSRLFCINSQLQNFFL